MCKQITEPKAFWLLPFDIHGGSRRALTSLCSFKYITCLVGLSAEAFRPNRLFLVPLFLLLLTQYPEGTIELFLSKSAWWGRERGRVALSTIALNVSRPGLRKCHRAWILHAKQTQQPKVSEPSPWPQEDLLNETTLPLHASGVQVTALSRFPLSNQCVIFFFFYRRKRYRLHILAARIVLAGIIDRKACSVGK